MGRIRESSTKLLFQCVFIVCITSVISVLSPLISYSADDYKMYLVSDDGNLAVDVSWSSEWNQETTEQIKVVVTGADPDEVITYYWMREITSTDDPDLADRVIEVTDTVTGPSTFYIDITYPEPDPTYWGDPDVDNNYTTRTVCWVEGVGVTKEWYHWWEYSAEQTGTLTSLTKNGVDAPDPDGDDTWSMAWNPAGGNPQYNESLGYYDEIVLTVQDINVPVIWRYLVEIVNDDVYPAVELSGQLDPVEGGGEQTVTITIPYPETDCQWGAPNLYGGYESNTTLWTSISEDYTWEYYWYPECDACSEELEATPEELVYAVHFPGEWPNGIVGLPSYMQAKESYFNSYVLTFTSNIDWEFPGWCCDLFTRIDKDGFYDEGNIRLYRTLNPDTDDDGFAEVDLDTGTTSNMNINIFGDIIGAPQNLARVNYIINQYYRGNYDEINATWAEIQAAIWDLLSVGHAESGAGYITVDEETGIGSGAFIEWDESVKDLIVQDANIEGVETYSPTHCELIGLIVQAGDGIQTTMIMVPYCFYQCLEAEGLISDVQEEYPDGMGNNAFSVSGGTCLVAAGTGMHAYADGTPGVINITVPGEVVRAYLYWDGETKYGIPHGVFDPVTINGVPKNGILIGGPQKFFSSGGNGDILFQSYRADITDLLVEGDNTLVLEDFDFNYPGDPIADGAGVVVIYNDLSGDNEIMIRDGQDLAYHGFAEPLRSTEPQTFTFTPSGEERTATLFILAGSVACESERPNEVVVDVEGETTTFVNSLGGHDGCEWDTESFNITIPAWAEELTVEVVSTDISDPNGASLAWIAAAICIPPPSYPEGTPTPLGPTATPTPTIPVVEDMSANMELDEGSGITTLDSSGHGNDGVLINDPSWAEGYCGQSVLFNGVDTYIDMGYVNVEGSAMTISAWIYANEYDHMATYHDARIVSKAIGTAEADHYWMLSTIYSGGEDRLRFRLKTGGTTSTLIATSGALETGVWTHVTAVYDGSYMILYKDGVEVGRTAKTGEIDQSAVVPAWIGGNPTLSTSRPFSGMIDEVRIYSLALEAGDIPALMSCSDLPTHTPTATSTPISDTPTPTSTPTPTPTLNPAEDTPTPTPTVTPTPIPAEDSDLPRSEDIMGYWDFNEASGDTANDSSLHENDGTLTNGVSWTDGKCGPGGVFDGVDDYVDVGPIDVDGSGMTIAAWIKADAFDHLSGNDARIVSKAVGTAEADHYWMLSTIETSGETRLRFRLKTNGYTTTLIASSGALEAGVWTHVAAVYNGMNMLLYKDGVLVGSRTKTGSITTAPSVSAWIGDNPPTAGSRPFDGIIDEVQVYNEALTQEELQTLMSLFIGCQESLDPITVDGDPSDWSLVDDFFADMYRAANPDKPVETKLYLRYDEDNSILYTMVKSVDGVTVLDMPDDAYIKIDDVKYVDGNNGNDGTPPDFEWFSIDGELRGWEAAIELEPGEYLLNVHTQVWDEEAQTSAVDDRNIPLTVPIE